MCLFSLPVKVLWCDLISITPGGWQMSFMSMGVKKNKVSSLFQVVDVDDGTVRWINADLVSHIVPRV